MSLLGGLLGGAGKVLSIKFVADIDQAMRNLDRLTMKAAKAAGITGTEGGQLDMLRGGFRGIFGRLEGSLLQRLTKGFGEMGEAGENALMKIAGKAGIAAAAVLGLAAAMKKMVEYGTEIENQMMMWEVVMGSRERARQTMQEALRFSLLTPFTPTEVFGATTAASTYNLDMYRRGAYGLGQNQNLAQIISGMGAVPGGHLTGGAPLGMVRAMHAVARGDLRLLRPYRGLMRTAVDPNSGQQYDAYEAAKAAGPIGSSTFLNKLIEGLGRVRAFSELAERQSNTISGLWSTITGYVEEFWIKLGGAAEGEGFVTFWTQLRNILKDVRDAGLRIMEYLGPGLVETGRAMGAALKGVWDTLKVIWQILGPVILPILQMIWQIFRSVLAISIALIETFVRFFRLISEVGVVLMGWSERLTGFGASLARIVDWLTKLVLWLQMIFQMMGIAIDGYIAQIRDALMSIPGWFERMFTAIGNTITSFYERHKSKLDPIINILRASYGIATLGASELAIQAYRHREQLAPVAGAAFDATRAGNPILNPLGLLGAYGDAANLLTTPSLGSSQQVGGLGTQINTTINIKEANRQDLRDVVPTNMSGNPNAAVQRRNK